MTTDTGFWIATDKEGIAIMSLGHSADEAIAAMIRDAGPFHDREGAELTGEAERGQCIARPCTKALYDHVTKWGGMTRWVVREGVADVVEDE